MDDSTNNTNMQAEPAAQEATPVQNFAFATPSEMGLTETDPNKIAAAPRPQPGMTFTPTSGSVSNIHHQLSQKEEDAGSDDTIIRPTTPLQQ